MYSIYLTSLTLIYFLELTIKLAGLINLLLFILLLFKIILLIGISDNPFIWYIFPERLWLW